METYNNGSPTPEFNNAGQIFNHDFYWESMSPEKREASRIVAHHYVSGSCNMLQISEELLHVPTYWTGAHRLIVFGFSQCEALEYVGKPFLQSSLTKASHLMHSHVFMWKS